MKKFLCILLAALLCLPLLVACGKKDETPADNTQAEDDAEARAAAEKAAAQQADKTAIAEAFNANFTLPSLFPAGEQSGEGGEAAEPATTTPLALVDMLLTSAETYSKATDMETQFTVRFLTDLNVLLSVKDGVAYLNFNGNPGYLTIDDGIVTETGGLPIEAERFNPMQMISAKLGEQVMEELGNTELTQDQVQGVIDTLPRLTAADLTVYGDGVYVLTDDYITRLVLAAMNAGAQLSGEDAEVPAEVAAAMAESQAQQTEMISGIVSALSLKIGFKLNGTAISQYVFHFEYTEQADAVIGGIIASMPGRGNKEAQPENQPEAAQAQHTGYEDEDDGAAEEEESIPVGTKIDVTLSVNGDKLPTALSLALFVPDEINATVNFTAAYANKTLTTFAGEADATLYNNEIDHEMCYVTADAASGNPRALQAAVTADTTVHATANFTIANFAKTATEGPVAATLSVSYANVKRLLEGNPVTNFEGLTFYDEDAELEDPQNASFTLTSSNNGRGNIRFTAALATEGQPTEFAALDVTVGDAPNFVALADNPLTELSGIVTQLLAKKPERGAYVYAIDGTNYYFEIQIEGDYEQDPKDPDNWIFVAKDTVVRLERCLPVAAAAPYDYYTVITVNGEGALVLTPVEPENN